MFTFYLTCAGIGCFHFLDGISLISLKAKRQMWVPHAFCSFCSDARSARAKLACSRCAQPLGWVQQVCSSLSKSKCDSSSGTIQSGISRGAKS